MPSLVEQNYLPLVESARARFSRGPGAAILDPQMTAEELILFLIHFSSLGVRMTEPVEGWIRRAGERCTACGQPALGRALVIHARHEAGHHLMMIEDTKRLVAYWNRTHARSLDADAYLRAPSPPSIDRYARLHEDVIQGPSPFAQIAIEYEIEGLSVSFGPAFLAHCVRLAGKEILAGLSFIEEHAALDVGHTKFNEAELGKLLAAEPAHAAALADAGCAALVAYGGFLEDSLARAKGDARRFGGAALSAAAG